MTSRRHTPRPVSSYLQNKWRSISLSCVTGTGAFDYVKGRFVGYQWRQSCPINRANSYLRLLYFLIERILMQSNIGLQHRRKFVLGSVCLRYVSTKIKWMMKYNFELLNTSIFFLNCRIKSSYTLAGQTLDHVDLKVHSGWTAQF